jgi:predicted transcriptional regulator YdeE
MIRLKPKLNGSIHVDFCNLPEGFGSKIFLGAGRIAVKCLAQTNNNQMKNQKIQSFNVVGIAVRTTNENGQAGQDIPALWNNFMTNGIADKILNKIDDSIYCIYTDYEKDHTKPYTTILGCKVADLQTIPDGMVGKNFEETNYIKFVAKGDISQGIVFNEWTKIWNSNLNRTFTADFEVYGESAHNPENAEVDIFIAVK